MSEQPTVKTSWLNRKVAGVPMVYLASAIAVILAVLAWQTIRNRNAVATDNTTGAPVVPTTGELVPSLSYGSVTTNPATQATPYVDNASIKTNDEWVHKSVAYLISQGTNAGDAQQAVQTYMNGGDLTYEQGKLRDIVVTQYGLPPALFDSGITAPKGNPPAVVMDPRRQAIANFYQTYLGRAAGPSDTLFWSNQPLSISQVETGIANSDESRLRRGDVAGSSEPAQVRYYYEQYLGREPSASEVAWQANSGLTSEQIRTNIEGSEEAKTYRAAHAVAAGG